MDYLDLKPITINDKALFDSYFKELCPVNSEYTFTNLFIWRKSYNIRYAIIDNQLCIFSRHGDLGAESVNFPIGQGNTKAAIEKLLEYFNNYGQPPLIRLYSHTDVEFLEKEFSDTFIITEDIDSFDYVYNTSDLIALSGSKYHAKRNHINKFRELYKFEYKPFTSELRSECQAMFDRWCNTKKETVSGISEQQDAVSELLANVETLKIKGGCITVDEKLVAFSFGEELNPTTAVIHLEHADTDFQGSFPVINQSFLQEEWFSFEYVNREEDMGLPGLRKAKQSYRPCHMIKKYIASLK